MLHRQKMIILSAYFEKERYGLLGPQTAATAISENTPFDCIVVGVSRQDRMPDVEKAVYDYFDGSPSVIGFSTLCGRDDLFSLAGRFRDAGTFTLLAGPQAGVDFSGEVGSRIHPHRFQGYADKFSFALQGPVEQIFPALIDFNLFQKREIPGLYSGTVGNAVASNPPAAWNALHIKRVDWNNFYRLKGDRLVPHAIRTAQVLQQMGCPYAARSREILIDPPASLADLTGPISLKSRGCSFCDVAADKGFHGSLDDEAVIRQIEGLPKNPDGRKIPFELINESPLPGLPRLLSTCRDLRLPLSRILLTLRADSLVKGADTLTEALETARKDGVQIVLASVGFEAFNDRILKNLNKGATLKTNLIAIRQMRRIKKRFPKHFGYLRQEGGNHGFIHPTPWDTPQIESATHQIISEYGLAADILPSHSTPLIIHHASALGDWIRSIEKKTGVIFKRHGSIIGWWETQKTPDVSHH